MIVEVAFTQGPPVPLSYIVPDSLTDAAQPGCRAVVPLRNMKRIGVIWKVSDSTGDEGLKSIHEIIDREPILTIEQRNFAEWISQYYYARLSSVLRLFLPKLIMEPDSLLIQRSRDDIGTESDWQDTFLDLLKKGRPLKVSTLREKLGECSEFYRKLAELERAGHVSISFSKPRRRSRADRIVKLIGIPDESVRLGFKQKLIVSHLRSIKNPQRMSALIEKLNVSKQSIQALGNRGVITITSAGSSPDADSSVQELMLNREQEDSVSAISKAVNDREFKVFLLHGVTGSGKTEVYVKLIWDAIEMGRTALLLQPEIALSEQVYSKLSSRFGDRICRLHSSVTASERYAIFKGIQTGRIRAVIGPRSTLFSPLTRVGLVIVDEEHDHSYKQSGTSPFYQGRDAAVVWGRLNGCPVVLGSATPSVESWGNVRLGKYELLKLTRRWDERSMPTIRHVVYRPKGDDEDPMSEYLTEKVAENLATGAQTVLFLNRRGFAPTVKCLDCRTTLRCPNCDIGLVYHMSHKSVMCHLCGHTSAQVETCPTCNGSNWGYFGAGTQRIEEHLKDRFPAARIGRLDMDAAAKIGSTKRLLSRFSKGGLDVLVGTQMVAKGLDFPGVRTVGVLSADSSMNLPDFRASERTYALLFQASGRAGRGKYPGEVVIQLDSEDSPLMRGVSESDFCDFLDEELQRREQLRYPPYRHLIMIKLKSGSATRVEDAAFELQRRIAARKRRFDRFMQVLGPAPAPFFKVRNNFRWRILIKTSSVRSSLAFIDGFLGGKDVQDCLRNVRVLIDVDPYDMM